MFAYSGTLQRVVLSNALVFVLAAPLLGLLHATWTALGEQDARSSRARERASRNACLAGQVLGLAILGWQVSAVGPDGTAIQHVLRLARIGQLDVSIDLALDATSAAMAFGVLGVGTAFFARRERVSLRLAATGCLVVVGALLAVLADDALAAALGASVASLAWAVSSARARPSATARIADVAFAAGLAVLFWVQGGSFTEGRFLPDLAPRVVAVTDTPLGDDADEAPAARIDLEGRVTKLRTPDKRVSPTDHATLTFDALPGALLYLDEARSPLADDQGRPLAAPLANVRLPAGLHTVRVHAGGGLDDSIVTRATFEPGSHVTLALLGPTLVYRHATGQLALTPARGVPPRTLLERRQGGLGVAFALLALAVLLRSAGAVGGAAALGPPASLALAIVVVRFAPLLSLAPFAAASVAVLGAACAALGAALATGAATWSELSRRLTFACAAASLTGAALNSRPAATGMLVAGMLGIATLALTIGRHYGAIGEKPAKTLMRRAAMWMAPWLARAPAYFAQRLSRVAIEVETHVFEFVPRALVAIVFAGGWVAAAVERSATLRLGARAAAIVKSPRSS